MNGAGLIWRYRIVIPAVSRLSQEDEVFEAIHLGLYIKTLVQQQQKTRQCVIVSGEVMCGLMTRLHL